MVQVINFLILQGQLTTLNEFLNELNAKTPPNGASISSKTYQMKEITQGWELGKLRYEFNPTIEPDRT